MSLPAVEEAPAELDGRRLRRRRNREAVVDALLDLYHQGTLRPSSAEIADRAGLSPRSLFRYFDDVDDLCRAAIARQEDRSLPLLVVEAQPTDPLEVRIRSLVDQRVHLYEIIAPVATVARAESPFRPVLAAELRRTRAHHRAQLAQWLDPELRRMDLAQADRTLAAVDVLCSFESYQLLRHDQERTAAEAGAVLVEGLAALVGAGLSPADPAT